MLDRIASLFADIAPAVDYWSVRLVDERAESIEVRDDVVEPPSDERSTGAMVTIVDGGGVGYAATGDLTASGLAEAARRARDWARAAAPVRLFDSRLHPRTGAQASYRTPVARPWHSIPFGDRLSMVREACRGLDRGEHIVDRQAAMAWYGVDTLLVSSLGAHIAQQIELVHPSLVAVANEGSITQVRSHGGHNCLRQGGLEQIDAIGLASHAERVGEEALMLLAAEPCPSGTTDLLLLPGQMILQVHESIGHPIELDRILGDERNYAGTTFVTIDMFGTYQYGSELLNVTFDPTRAEEASSYGFDDDGTPAHREHLIRDGILVRPLGGATSQARAGIDGVACARASGWDRPPVDRMANVNVEPGRSTLAELIGSIERGMLMDTNRSWSIDQRRDKFQFGCEVGRLIVDGEVGPLVRNSGYRGRSATFWRSLAGVGDASLVEVLGPTNCGKGEPNQAIHTGHASPPCLFRAVEVFGGE